MGGLSYSKLYDIDPYFIRYPQQSLVERCRPRRRWTCTSTDSACAPSAARRRVRSSQRDAGHRLPQRRSRDPRCHSAANSASTTSFYSSERSLKRGLHEWSYNVGALGRLRGRERRLRTARVRRVSSLRRHRRDHAGRASRGQERAPERRTVGDDRACSRGPLPLPRPRASTKARPVALRSRATATSASTGVLRRSRARTVSITPISRPTACAVHLASTRHSTQVTPGATGRRRPALAIHRLPRLAVGRLLRTRCLPRAGPQGGHLELRPFAVRRPRERFQ